MKKEKLQNFDQVVLDKKVAAEIENCSWLMSWSLAW